MGGRGRFALKSIYGTYLAASTPKRVPHPPYKVYGVRLTSHYRDNGAVFLVKKSRPRGYYLFETEWAKYLKANADNSLTADGSMHELLANFKPECIKGAKVNELGRRNGSVYGGNVNGKGESSSFGSGSQNFRMSEETGEIQECKTDSGPKINHRCIFPFVFDGKTYKTCVYDMLGPGHLDIWCPTKVDSKGNYIEGQDNWGFCGSACLTGCQGGSLAACRQICSYKADL